MKQLLFNIKDILEKLFYILNRQQKLFCMVVFIMTIIGAALETIGVSIILPFVQAMMFPEQLAENRLIAELLHLFHIDGSFQIIIFVAIGVVLVYIFKNIYMILLSYIRTKFSGMIQRDLGVYMMQSYLKRGYPFFLTMNISQLQRGISGDVSGVYTLLYNLFRLMAELFTVSAIGIFILLEDMVMSLFMLGIAGISVLTTVLICKTKMKRLGESFRQYDFETRKYSYQVFEGIKEVMVMNKQEYFVKAYEKSSKKKQVAMIMQTVVAESPTYIFEAVCVIAMLLAICFRLFLGGDNSEFIPNVATIVVAAFRIMPSMGRIANNANNILFNIPSLNATYANVKEANEYVYYVKEGVLEEEKENKLEFKKKLELKNITWKYAGSDENIIDQLNLTIQHGESVAFIGESGAGKSTIADIIMGLFRPQEGGVYMDGVDIKAIPNRWCRIIGYVPQSVYILDDSIRKNVAFGIPDEEIRDEMVWEALAQAQMKEFVRNLPGKLDTILGDRGIRFSGGQKQRIAIARALYYNPDIMVLDEATSALDNRTEEAIMEAIDYLQGKKTLIIVAHRLTTVKNCDHIYEIKSGKAVKCNKQDIFGK